MAFLYFLTDGEYIKIGYTTQDVKYRVDDLQTGNPKVLSILRVVEMPYLIVQDCETCLHNMFYEHNVLNEWYDLCVMNIIDQMSDTDIIMLCDKIDPIGKSKEYRILTKQEYEEIKKFPNHPGKQGSYRTWISDPLHQKNGRFVIESVSLTKLKNNAYRAYVDFMNGTSKYTIRYDQ